LSKSELDVYEATQQILNTLSRITQDRAGGLFPHGVTLIDLEVSVGDAAKVHVKVEGPATAAREQMFRDTFAALARLALPDLQTDDGTVARMLLAETLTPASSSYDAAQAQTSMNAMKSAVVHRLTKPSDFGAAGATNHRDIICAPGQFAGFSKNTSGEVVVDAAIEANIDDIVNRANTGAPGVYYAHLKMAIDTADSTVTDPFSAITSVGGVATLGGTWGWRKAGTAAPGGKLVAIPTASGGVILRNQFYTLKV